MTEAVTNRPVQRRRAAETTRTSFDNPLGRALNADGFGTKLVCAGSPSATVDDRSSHDPIGTSFPDNLVDDIFLRELIDGIGLEAVIEAMGYFQEEAPVRAASIRHAFNSGTIPVLRREVHALAGSARAVGLLALGEAAYAMQSLTEKEEPDALLIQDLLALIDRTLRALSSWIDRESPSRIQIATP